MDIIRQEHDKHDQIPLIYHCGVKWFTAHARNMIVVPSPNPAQDSSSQKKGGVEAQILGKKYCARSLLRFIIIGMLKSPAQCIRYFAVSLLTLVWAVI